VESGSCVLEKYIAPFLKKEVLRTNLKYKTLSGNHTAQRIAKGWEGRELGTGK
jgi:hypothetical protein